MPARVGVNRSMPPGTVVPVLAYEDIDAAVVWLCRAFGFRERLRIGNHRCQLTVGDGSIVIVAGTAECRSPADSIMVHVEAVDAHHDHAVRSGSRIVSPPADYPYGERQYTAEDPSGRRWTFSQPIRDVDPAEWGGHLLDAASHEAGAPK